MINAKVMVGERNFSPFHLQTFPFVVHWHLKCVAVLLQKSLDLSTTFGMVNFLKHIARIFRIFLLQLQ